MDNNWLLDFHYTGTKYKPLLQAAWNRYDKSLLWRMLSALRQGSEDEPVRTKALTERSQHRLLIINFPAISIGLPEQH
jgi:hypothetical protein